MKSPRKKLHSFTAWQGPSVIDGSPIALFVMRSRSRGANKKTGEMIQTYILRTDLSPIETLQQGLDRAICGNCVHSSKGNGGQGTCYVRADTGPTQVFRAAQRGKYPAISLEEGKAQLAGELVRLGTYGDPAAIPGEVWETLLAEVSDCTGYTHGWKGETGQWLKAYVMASCDTAEDYTRARAEGWRAFYVVPKGTDKVEGSFLCPASEEGGKKLTCSECLACNGLKTGRKASVFIPVHGLAFKQARFNNLITIGRA